MSNSQRIKGGIHYQIWHHEVQKFNRLLWGRAHRGLQLCQRCSITRIQKIKVELRRESPQSATARPMKKDLLKNINFPSYGEPTKHNEDALEDGSVSD